jgi:Kef-type K+ transport system membrane component KefB
MDSRLLQAVFIFLAFTCLIVPLSKWAGLGPVIGYLIAGVLIAHSHKSSDLIKQALQSDEDHWGNES